MRPRRGLASYLIPLVDVDRMNSCALTVVCTLVAVAPLHAHRPVFVRAEARMPSTAVTIPDPNISWAFYAVLPTPGTRQFYRLQGRAGQVIFVQLLVPLRSGLRAEPPRAAVIGPTGADSIALWYSASPASSRAAAGDLSTAGVYRAQSRIDDRVGFYERFSQTRYDQYPPLRVVLPEDGTYWIVVSSTGRAAGAYVLAVGTEEIFGIHDLPRFPAWWWKARRHAGLPVWHGVAFIGAVLVVIVAGIVRLWRAWR